MAFRFSELGPLVLSDPATAAEKLADAIASAGGSLTAATKVLEVDYRTVTRWLERLLAAGHDVRHMALERVHDARALAVSQGKEPPPIPGARGGRPFKQRPSPGPAADR